MVIAYVYEASLHCPKCAEKRFGRALQNPETRDAEGNPLGAVFAWNTLPEELAYCDDCMEPLQA